MGWVKVNECCLFYVAGYLTTGWQGGWSGDDGKSHCASYIRWNASCRLMAVEFSKIGLIYWCWWLWWAVWLVFWFIMCISKPCQWLPWPACSSLHCFNLFLFPFIEYDYLPSTLCCSSSGGYLLHNTCLPEKVPGPTAVYIYMVGCFSMANGVVIVSFCIR